MITINLTDTNPTQILNENPKRKRLRIQMQPFDIDANNTERIHIGFGFQPVATVANPNQGEVLLQGATIDEPQFTGQLTQNRKKIIWATSSKANQSLTIEEEVELE